MADTKTFYPLDATLVKADDFRGAQFVDFAGLDYFWSLAKNYVDTADAALAARATALEATVNGTPNAEGVLENGLVQKVDALRSEVDALGADGGIQNMIDASIEALDLDNKFAGADTAAQGYANTALTDAKAYTDERETAIDGKIGAVAADLDTHVKDAVAHVTADERTAWNKAKADIDTFLKDADMTQNAVDTLAELQKYMTEDGEAAAKLVNRVGALETSVGAAASVGEDGTEVPATGLYKVIADNEKTTAAALSDLDGKITTLDADLKKYADDAADAAEAQALADAKAHVAEELAKYYTSAQVDGFLADKADKATTYTKDEVDGLLTANSTADQAYAKGYVDTLFSEITFVSKASIDSLFA